MPPSQLSTGSVSSTSSIVDSRPSDVSILARDESGLPVVTLSLDRRTLTFGELVYSQCLIVVSKGALS